MSLEEAIHKVSALPAKRFCLEKRGLLQASYGADLVVFSADEIGTRGNYVEPDHSPEGIEHVLINGDWALRDGRLEEGTCPGQPLRA